MDFRYIGIVQHVDRKLNDARMRRQEHQQTEGGKHNGNVGPSAFSGPRHIGLHNQQLNDLSRSAGLGGL